MTYVTESLGTLPHSKVAGVPGESWLPLPLGMATFIHPLSTPHPRECWGGGPCFKAGSQTPQYQLGHTQQHRHRGDPGVSPRAGQGENGVRAEPTIRQGPLRPFPAPATGNLLVEACKGSAVPQRCGRAF